MIISNNRRQNGFSLFELLMTVAILGIMGSFAITALGDETSAVENARDQRNAQEVVATCVAAHAAGVNFVVGNQIDATVRKIIEGAAPSNGVFKNHVFKVNLVGEADIAGAIRFLKIQNGELTYSHDS